MVIDDMVPEEMLMDMDSLDVKGFEAEDFGREEVLVECSFMYLLLFCMEWFKS